MNVRLKAYNLGYLAHVRPLELVPWFRRYRTAKITPSDAQNHLKTHFWSIFGFLMRKMSFSKVEKVNLKIFSAVLYKKLRYLSSRRKRAHRILID